MNHGSDFFFFFFFFLLPQFDSVLLHLLSFGIQKQSFKVLKGNLKEKTMMIFDSFLGGKNKQTLSGPVKTTFLAPTTTSSPTVGIVNGTVGFRP
ncbi:hypothetical protein DDB_G0276507 [Dictyostelium discoideum AX4]|uniref:Uncharacterized protein n=1 Tax=Dictyostelium discoideum TaxID=44689 RepID=Q551K0_DICDI|nr:hypothetical protein DDB_G0276507 [Dictyostelium discoideum AX4]EAL69207.1 hypothetical protein DDB_G0276507 [Dictyostelium discoideum AX4]|eukprot:XP_643134.1 hypothetical protein DDB_G0276507 [Dictyostelium discoideum AX4]